MFRRRWAATAMVVAATVTLAGCGRAESGSGEAAAADTISSGPASGSVSIWAQGNEATQLKEVLKPFLAENPDLDVEVTELPWPTAQDKYQTAIAGGSTPDIGMMGSTWMAGFQTALAPVPEAIDLSGMYQGPRDSVTFDDTAKAVPLYTDTRAIYYRTDMAAAAGYSTPPTDWAGFKAMAKAMQTEGGAEWGLALTTGLPNTFEGLVLPFAWSTGTGAQLVDGDEYDMDSPEVVEATEYLKSFFDEGIADKNPNPDINAIGSEFVDGKTAMFISGPYTNYVIGQIAGPEFADKYSVMPIPTNDGGTSSSLSGGASLAVFQDSDNRDAAWKVVEYMSRPETQAAYYGLTADLPTQQAAYDDPSITEDKTFAVFRDQAETSRATPNTPTWGQVSAAADKSLEQVAKAGADPATVFEELQATADGIGTN